MKVKHVDIRDKTQLEKNARLLRPTGMQSQLQLRLPSRIANQTQETHQNIMPHNLHRQQSLFFKKSPLERTRCLFCTLRAVGECRGGLRRETW